MPVVVYFIYMQLFSISRLYFLYVQPEQASCCSEMGPYSSSWKKTIFFFIFRSPDGKYIASGAIDGIINIFDVASGKLVHTLEGIILSVS